MNRLCAANIVFLWMLCVFARAEATHAGATWQYAGARYQGFFDHDSTGSVTLTVAAGQSTGPEELRLTWLALSQGDMRTTVSTYDPATTYTSRFPVSEFTTGSQYLVARFPDSRRISWTYFIRNAPSFAPPDGVETSNSIAGRSRDVVLRKMDLFFDADTSGTWLANNPDADFHWMREDVYYAYSLFSRGDAGSVARANATLAEFCRSQQLVTTQPEYGLYFTNNSDRRVPDYASTYFGAPVLARMLLHRPAGLSPDVELAMRNSLTTACGFLRIHLPNYTPNHTNFYALGIAALSLTGRANSNPVFIDAARDRMAVFYDNMMQTGAPGEFNSPVYSGVTQWALKMLAEDSPDTRTAAMARVMHERLWLDTALYYHPQQAHQAGPYSRTYEDGLRGGTGLTGFLNSVELGTAGYDSPGRLSENLDVLHSLDINPAHLEASLPLTMSDEIRHAHLLRSLPSFAWQKTRWQDTSCYLSPSFTLGTGSVTQGFTNESFFLQVFEPQAPGGFAPVFSRTLGSSDEAVGYDGVGMMSQYGLQGGPRAVYLADRVLPGTEPPAKRAFLALVADERFAQWQDIHVNGIPATVPFDFGLSDTIFLRRAGTCLAVQPLYAVASGTRNRVGAVTRGASHLNISLHAVDSAGTETLAGRQIECGFAVACAEQSDWPTYAAFMSDYLATSAVTVAETATTRSVAWSHHGTIEFQFDRMQHKFLSRRVDGADLPSLLVDAPFARQVASDTSLDLRDLHVSGVQPYSWVVYPEGSDTALLVNPAHVPASVTTTWTTGTLELQPYEMIRLTRPPAAAVMRWDTY